MDESKEAQEKFWDQRYVKDHIFGEKPTFFLLEQENLLKKQKKALCLADGQGRNGVFLAKLGLDVTSIDVSPKGIEYAKKFAKQEGVEDKYHTIQENILEYDLKDSFDLIVVAFCQFTKNHKELHKKLTKLLDKGGYMLVVGYTPKQLEYKTGGPSQIENLYDLKTLKEEFSDLKFIEGEEKDLDLKEGERHTGISALVTFVGQKE